MKYRPMIVEWIDTRGSHGTVYSLKEFENFSPVMIHSVGWGWETKEKVVLASDFNPPSEDEADVRDIQVIPRECIKKVIYLRAEEKKRQVKRQSGKPATG